MEKLNDLQVSTTFGGEMLSLAVCVQAIEAYRRSDYFSHIARLGRLLKHEVNSAAQELGTPLRVIGYDAIPMFLFDRNPERHVPLAKEFVGLMAEQGVLLRRDVNFISLAHTATHIQKTVAACREALNIMLQKGLFEENKATAAEAVV